MDDKDRGDDREWNESLFAFAEQIERGEWPIEMPFSVELDMQRGQPSVRVSRGEPADQPEPPDKPGRMILPVTVRLGPANMRQIVLERIAETANYDRRLLASLLLLARIDRECFLRTAAEHFADVLCDRDECLADDPAFARFLAAMHERDVELIADLVERATAMQHAAGG